MAIRELLNEKLLKRAEKYYDSSSFEHVKKLIAVVEASKIYFKKDHCTCLDGDVCSTCVENINACKNALAEVERETPPTP